jgi:HEXXH motif-containing protein
MSLKEFLNPAGSAHLTQTLAMQGTLTRLIRFDETIGRMANTAGHALKYLLDKSTPADRFALASRPEFHRYVVACEENEHPPSDLELPLLLNAARCSGMSELEVSLSSDVSPCRVLVGKMELRITTSLKSPILRIQNEQFCLISADTRLSVELAHTSSPATQIPRLVDDWPTFRNPFNDGNRSLILDDMQRDQFQGEIARAVEFLNELVPQAIQEMSITAPYLSPVVSKSNNVGIPSFSSPMLPGIIFVGMLRPDGQMTDWRHLAELIFHEHLHNRLYLLDTLCPLTEINTPYDETFYSPWKKVDRPLDGILHSLYVFSHLAWLWKYAFQTATNESIARFADARRCEHLLSLSKVDQVSVLAARGLTDAGKAVVHSSIETATLAQKEPLHAA